MRFSEIYQKLDEEVAILQSYIKFNIWTDGKSDFFDVPKSAKLPDSHQTLGEFMQIPNNQSGIYVFVCIEETTIASVDNFNNGKSYAQVRQTDDTTVNILAGEVLYVGECSIFSNRLSAHLDTEDSSSTYGLHLYSTNRIAIKPENFKLLLFPLKDSFYPTTLKEKDPAKKQLREMIETKLKAIFTPWIGK